LHLKGKSSLPRLAQEGSQMKKQKPKTNVRGVSRRDFLKTVGAGAPTITLMAGEPGSMARTSPEPQTRDASDKFTPIELTPHYTAASQDFGKREGAFALGGECEKDLLIRVPGGKRRLQGIPFWLGPGDVDSKSWIVLSTKPGATVAAHAEIPLHEKAHYLLLASFTDFDPNETPGPGKDAFQQVGQHLADITLVYEDDGTHAAPIRRRFESNAVIEPFGHWSFIALAPGKARGVKLTDPLRNAMDWGRQQDGQTGGGPGGGRGMGTLWISALPNPEPDRAIRAVRFDAAAENALVVCGLTLYHRATFPLRWEPRAFYRITLPEPFGQDEKRWRVELDLGWVGRTITLPDFQPDAWLASPAAGLGEAAIYDPANRYYYVELAANAAATLTLEDAKAKKTYTFDLSKIEPGKELEASEGGSRIEILPPGRRWINGRVLDPDTKKPTAVRMAFRTKEGRYIPPYGHRAEINDAQFQDYGADIKLMDASFAYIDGTFMVDLPPGEVYVEITKGFEHQAVRQKLEIAPGQRELTLEIPRLANLRAKGWVTSDTHVHYLSPSTALLEAQAEGLNLINLLAMHGGELFSNFGDIPHGPVISPDRESMVWVGSENRHHLLGHISLTGIHGTVFPLSADGPSEAMLGEPLWSSMAEWADRCREHQGLVVSPHFPYPTGEVAADIVLGKIDAVEIWTRDEPAPHFTPLLQFDTLRYLDWYHYLNCGYRLPAVAGTDKMGAYMPAGANRVYAYLGQEEFNFPNFAQAVKAGNTFATTGPLLMFHADGHAPGAEITLGAGGGTIEVSAQAQCFVPFHRMEIVYNGKVVASREEPQGSRIMHLTEKVKVPGPGWLAARCASKLGPTTSWRLKIAAHTSPVYIKVARRDLFSPEAAQYFLQLIDGSQAYVETIATRPDPETFARIRKVYTDARAALHQRMHQHGVPH
jgi:hypothetical protein